MCFSERASYKNVYDGLGMGSKFYEPTTTSWAIYSFALILYYLCGWVWAGERTTEPQWRYRVFTFFIKTLSKRMKVICLLLLRMKAFTGVPTIQNCNTKWKYEYWNESSKKTDTAMWTHDDDVEESCDDMCQCAKWERAVRYYHQRCWLFRMRNPIR